ncbi:MAG TPA: hypothetical protein VGG32_05970 [Thermoplasmata archaeon]
MGRSAMSALTDVLVELNPDLTRHQAFARAARIIDYACRRGQLRGPDYAGQLFASAVRGDRRVRPGPSEQMLRNLVQDALDAFPWGDHYDSKGNLIEEPIEGGDCVEYFCGWTTDARLLLHPRSREARAERARRAEIRARQSPAPSAPVTPPVPA